MNESKRTSQVLKRFRELYPDGVAWKFNDRIARSRPDAAFMRGGIVTFIEFKMEGNEPTSGQTLEMEKLNRAGFSTYVAWFVGKDITFEVGDPVQYMSVDAFCRFLS